MLTDISDLGLSCPQGGRFYVCQGNATRFIGCCKSDPCANGNGACPKADLTSSSFSADLFDDIPPQNCSDSRGANVWFTCNKTSPPFLGCCAKNPCTNNGCAATNLIPARLSDNAAAAAVFLTTTSDPATTSSAAPAMTHQSSSGLHPGAIAGIVIGALALVALLVFFLVWKLGWRLRHQDRESRVIAEFPATYIPNALPDMSPHKSDAFKGDTSYRSSNNSSVDPDFAAAAGAHRRSPSDPNDFPMPTMLYPGQQQGQYARVSVTDDIPEHPPRFDDVVRGGGNGAAAAAAASEKSPSSTPPTSGRTSPHPYSRQFERPTPEMQEASPLTGRGASQPASKWIPYRPT